MKGLLLEPSSGADAKCRLLERSGFSSGERRDEKWLQRLLFEHPYLIPLGVIDPSSSDLVVVCRELAIPKDGASIFLDILAVTSRGRLVLVECKLWRNPQARREVIAQILEYASLLRRWSYSDLAVRLKTSLKLSSANPLFDLVRAHHPGIDEAAFVDAVSRCLAAGDFDLIVAGDGIRSDLQAIAAHLNSHSGLSARLALLEIQRWKDEEGRTVIVPFVPCRTEVVQHRVIVDAGGVPLVLVSQTDEVDVAAPAIEKEQKAQIAENRAFWQTFIDAVHFDHAEQAPPRHGGNNWVKISLPDPIKWLTAYRSKAEAGVFFRLINEGGRSLFQQLEDQASELSAEVAWEIVFDIKAEEPFNATIGAVKALDRSHKPTDADLLSWLRNTTNRFVTAIRLRLSGRQDGSAQFGELS